MNLDELQSVRDRERQSDSLQQLRESFYEDVGAFLEELREEREAVAERVDDPFDAPAVNRLTDDIKTAEQTVEAIYERRVGKLVKMASFAAADMPTDDEGLTAEERDLFEDLVASIEHNRDRVFAVVDGEEPPTDAAPDRQADVPPSSDPADVDGSEPSVDAAGLMGGSGRQEGGEPESPPEQSAASGSHPVPPEGPPDRDADPADVAGTKERSDTVPAGAGNTGNTAQSSPRRDQQSETPRADATGSTGSGSDVPRTTVRITQDVGEIFGVDEREYDLSPEDVVTLPAANAEPLVERDAAERID